MVVDLSRHGDLWEDVYDAMIAETREGEERLDWEADETEELDALVQPQAQAEQELGYLRAVDQRLEVGVVSPPD